MSRFNTGNPLGSGSPLDLDDNAKNLDEAVNSTAMTFRDRMGRLRATVAGGTDPSGVAQVAADAADRAESASEVAMAAGWVYATVAEGEAVRAAGEYFWVVSADDSGVLDLWLMGSTEATDTGKRTVSKVYLDGVEKNIEEVEKNLGEVARKLGETEPDNITHGFVDADGRLLGYFNDEGEFECYPTPLLIDRVNVVKSNEDTEFLYLLLDADGKVIWSIDKNGDQFPAIGGAGGVAIPSKTPIPDVTSTVTVKSFNRVIEKLDLKTTAIGRSDDPTIEINGDGLTHPKMLYIPQGWNGYKYWLAATPTFGVTPPAGANYENPHVWASNDCVAWVEPAGGPIDLPEDGNPSYWSDTHLAIDDDGWMYCFYRGQYFSFASGRCVVAKRSRDGTNWSDRIMIYNTDDEPLSASNVIASPSFFNNGSRWVCVDVIDGTASFPLPSTGYSENRAVIKRASSFVTSGYEPYDQTQIIDYVNREWGADKEPWHIDAIQVGNLHLHLVNVGTNGISKGSEIYLAWSSDGWRFTVLGRLDTSIFNIYRSSINIKEVRQDEIDFDVVVARTNGTMDLYKLTLEVN